MDLVKQPKKREEQKQ